MKLQYRNFLVQCLKIEFIIEMLQKPLINKQGLNSSSGGTGA